MVSQVANTLTTRLSTTETPRKAETFHSQRQGRTHQGTGTFIADRKPEKNSAERDRQLGQMAGEFAARAGAAGFTIEDLLEQLHERQTVESNRR